MVSEHSIYMMFKMVILFLIPFVEPQLAGILGGIAYIIVRHELKIQQLSTKGVGIVMFFGWLGAWAVVHILAEHYPEIPHVWEHILSASVGFISYDAMMVFGANTTSVVGFVVNTFKEIVVKGVSKWK